jgi:small-conductance mechanosensitive channel
MYKSMKQYSHYTSHLAYLGAASIAVSFFCIAAFSFAADQAETTKESNPRAIMERAEDRADMMQERRENMASNTEEVREKIQERRSALSEKIQDRVYNLLQNIIRRMDAAAERMRAIGNRMETRARILSEKGANITEVQTQIEKSRTSIEAASAILRSDLGSFVLTEKPREQFATVRASVKEAGAHIKDSRDALRLALAALKKAAQDAQVGSGVSEAVQKNTTSKEPVSE